MHKFFKILHENLGYAKVEFIFVKYKIFLPFRPLVRASASLGLLAFKRAICSGLAKNILRRYSVLDEGGFATVSNPVMADDGICMLLKSKLDKGAVRKKRGNKAKFKKTSNCNYLLEGTGLLVLVLELLNILCRVTTSPSLTP